MMPYAAESRSLPNLTAKGFNFRLFTFDFRCVRREGICPDARSGIGVGHPVPDTNYGFHVPEASPGVAQNFAA
jgi:hypothetical protein